MTKKSASIETLNYAFNELKALETRIAQAVATYNFGTAMDLAGYALEVERRVLSLAQECPEHEMPTRNIKNIEARRLMQQLLEIADLAADYIEDERGAELLSNLKDDVEDGMNKPAFKKIINPNVQQKDFTSPAGEVK